MSVIVDDLKKMRNGDKYRYAFFLLNNNAIYFRQYATSLYTCLK